MNIADLIGFIGVSLILIAYFLNINNKLDANDLSYILLNLVGAFMACVASVMMKSYPFVLLEGIWTIVSIAGLVKHFRKK